MLKTATIFGALRLSVVLGLALGVCAECEAVAMQEAAVSAATPGPNAESAGAKFSERSETASRKEAGANSISGGAPTIVIGFVGGFVRKGNAVHSPVKVAARLKESYPSGVHVEIFENHHREEAYRKVMQLLDASHDGKVSTEERRAARIIIYGMSWGGSETVMLARELQKQNIPVLLTVQVDSVGKLGQDDGAIPANVGEAVNFYQTDGLLHGRSEIHAVDARQTKILGSFHYEYKKQAPSCEEYPWWDRLLAKYHTEIECDPAVWGRVEALIRRKLAAAESRSAL
jgi:hypothetical protein